LQLLTEYQGLPTQEDIKMPASILLHGKARVFALTLFTLSVVAFEFGATSAAYGQRSVVPLDELTSDPVVAEFLPKYNKFLLDRNFAAATSEVLILLAKHPDNKDAQIAGTCGWAFASLAAHQHGPLPERKITAQTATERLRSCLAMIEKCPPEERQKKYVTLQRWIRVCLTASLCDAGSYTLALQTVEDFFATDSDNVACGKAASMLCASFPKVSDQEALISSLKALTQRYKGKPGSAQVLWEIAQIYDEKGDEAGFRSVVETMEADFPGDNIYKQALRKFAAQRKIHDYDALRKANAAKAKAVPTSWTALMRNPDLASTGICATSSCGCGCGTTTTTTATACCKP
jgi:hypothetical protein